MAAASSRQDDGGPADLDGPQPGAETGHIDVIPQVLDGRLCALLSLLDGLVNLLPLTSKALYLRVRMSYKQQAQHTARDAHMDAISQGLPTLTRAC